MKLHYLAAAAAAALSPLCAQKIEDVRSGFEFAKYEVDQGRPEVAAKALREAYSKLKVMSSKEKGKDSKVEKEITSLMRKVDSKGKALVDAQIRAAKALHKPARRT